MHSTWDTGLLTAPQIIAHHNEALGGWFAKLKNDSLLLTITTSDSHPATAVHSALSGNDSLLCQEMTSHPC
jgi:hypothetical protein